MNWQCSVDDLWLKLLREILSHGMPSEPRGMLTKELLHTTIVTDMRRPVLLAPARRLNYQFMLAEAYWILSGDDRVETIAPYNRHIVDYSDDGKTFFGAYGPRIVSQLNYVVQKLHQDLDTRQAGLTIWHENPPLTKDLPCTISIFFNSRNYQLHVSVFMRSSDAWLGLPYDIFAFSMLGHLVCALVNEAFKSPPLISPGLLHLTAVSSHLYQKDWSAAGSCIYQWSYQEQPMTPDELFKSSTTLMAQLHELRDCKEKRWWLK